MKKLLFAIAVILMAFVLFGCNSNVVTPEPTVTLTPTLEPTPEPTPTLNPNLVLPPKQYGIAMKIEIWDEAGNYSVTWTKTQVGEGLTEEETNNKMLIEYYAVLANCPNTTIMIGGGKIHVNNFDDNGLKLSDECRTVLKIIQKGKYK